jgi:hypothetical protein
MIYCIGLRARYDAKLAGGLPFYKYGRGIHNYSFHQGGAVWISEAEAWDFLAKSNMTEIRGVYGVLADWEADTIQLPNEPFRRLTKNAEIVKLTTGGKPSTLRSPAAPGETDPEA